MKKIRLEKGITLIALIITIIILLILAVVTIGSIRDSKIIDYAQDAASEYTVAQEKEQIGLALSEWQIQNVLGEKSFREVVEASLEGIATVEGDNEGPLTITMNKTGNKYTVTNNGEIVPIEKGIVLSDTKISIIPGQTKTITATLVGGIKGDISYSSSDENIVTVDESGIVTGIAVGTGTITATCGNYSATCTVSVNDFEIEVSKDASGTPLNRVRLSIKPVITAAVFSEEEAVKIVATESGAQDVTTLQELIVAYVNGTTGSQYDIKNDYDKMITDLSGVYQGDFSTPQSTFAFLMEQLGEDATTVQEYAASIYNIDNATEKILKINGEQVTEEDGVEWYSNNVRYTLYNNGRYEIQLELDGRVGTDIIEVTEIELVGKYVKFDSDDDGSIDDEILYRVLYEDDELGEGYGAQIITADVTQMSMVTLGPDDEEIVESELVEIYDDTNLDIEKAMWSYNNVVTTLNKACKNQVKLKSGITTGQVRSVGTNPLNPNQDTDDYIDSSEITDYSGTWFDTFSGKLKASGLVDSSDTSKISNKNLIVASYEQYWICSRSFNSPSMGAKATFGVLNVFGAIELNGNGSFSSFGGTYKVRPIVSLEYGVLTKAIEDETGLGTEASPLILK